MKLDIRILRLLLMTPNYARTDGGGTRGHSNTGARLEIAAAQR
jgi:hypothetical protein